MLNKISNLSRTNQVQFGNLVINKPWEEWNDDVAAAVLKSTSIRSIITKDAAEGRDTYISFNTDEQHGNISDPITFIMTLDVNKGREGELHFRSSTINTPVKKGSFSNSYNYEISGSRNPGQSIARQIREHDTETFSKEQAKEEIKQIAGGIDVRA